MRRLLLPIFLIFVASCSIDRAPVAKRESHVSEICGNKVSDDYYWMRLTDQQKAADSSDAQTLAVLDYLKKENEYAEKYFKPHGKLIESLYDEMKQRVKENETSVPYLDNGYWYYTKYEEGKNYPIYYRKADKEESAEEVILDVNSLAEGKSFCYISNPSVSPDNRYLAFFVDFVGRNRFRLMIKDLHTGDFLPNRIENTSYIGEWGADSRSYYYVITDPVTLRSYKVIKHHLGMSENDVVFHETDETFRLSIRKTSDKKYIVILSEQTLSNEEYYFPVDGSGSVRSFSPREKGVKYSIDHIGNSFFIKTNRDGAQNYKIMTCNDSNTDKSHWKELVPADESKYINSFVLFDNFLVISETNNANMSLKVVNIANERSHYIAFDDLCYTAEIGINKNPDSQILRLTYSSLSTPLSEFDYDLKSRSMTLLQEAEVPGYDKNAYFVDRIWATARDGAKIPVSIVYKKGFVKNGTAKALLTAIGAYGYFQRPSFNASVISLLDRGFVYAIAHVRGGSEMGEQWYTDGKLMKKKNSFNDFNDCAIHLIANGYTSSNSLFAEGRSVGGLLVGAVINMDPELYKGVILGGPFVDVVNTMSDETIPLTSFEWDEWGDPRKEPYYSYMHSYSPYDNIAAQDYPNTFVSCGFWDFKVQYWESAKWVAKMRRTKTDDNVLIFRCDMESGHSGTTGRYTRIRDKAREYAFILSIQ